MINMKRTFNKEKQTHKPYFSFKYLAAYQNSNNAYINTGCKANK